MPDLTLQDAFSPYYAGRKDRRKKTAERADKTGSKIAGEAQNKVDEPPVDAELNNTEH